MFPSATISYNYSTSISEEASVSTETRPHDHLNNLSTPISPHPKLKAKRSQPGNPDPDAEVVALSPNSLLATNRFVCEICGKGFQRDQNLQLHRRGHNLPWRLRQRNNNNNGKEVVKKRVYVCPEPSCVHHQPSRALGDLTGIKKHFCRKHGEKKWKCDKCSKKYAVYSDWKAHVKTCGTREYRCDCGTLFSRKDSFITHRAFCDALAEESARLIANSSNHASTINNTLTTPPLLPSFPNTWNPPSYNNSNPNLLAFLPIPNPNPNPNPTTSSFDLNPQVNPFQPFVNPYFSAAAAAPPHFSATALLQSASNMGHLRPIAGGFDFVARGISASQSVDRLTRDFLGVDSGEELLPLPGVGVDVVTAGPCVGDGRGGDQTEPAVRFGFPPVTRAWGDR